MQEVSETSADSIFAPAHARSERLLLLLYTHEGGGWVACSLSDSVDSPELLSNSSRSDWYIGRREGEVDMKS